VVVVSLDAALEAMIEGAARVVVAAGPRAIVAYPLVVPGRNVMSGSWPQCHVCFKIGHTADKCCHRSEGDYVPEPRITIATSGPGVDHA
jgi:hypothetical protein